MESSGTFNGLPVAECEVRFDGIAHPPILREKRIGQRTQDDITISAKDFEDFAKQAYASKDGYAIRINPQTGQKEMFVAGTRHFSQWFLNVWDVPITLIEHPEELLGPIGYPIDWLEHLGGYDIVGWLDPWRKMKQKKLSKIAKEQGVDVLYGHSRGGAIVADMDVGPYTRKIGLDSAMVITKNKGLTNYREKEWFDVVIGATGQENKTMDFGPKFHNVWQ